MRLVLLTLSAFITTSFAYIHDNVDLFELAQERANQIGAQPLQEIRDHEKAIREPFSQKRELVQRQIDAWNLLLKEQNSRMQVWMDEANETARACAQEKKNALMARPEFVFAQMEIAELEAKIELVKQDPYFQSTLESTHNDHAKRLESVSKAYHARLAESAYNREHGLLWSLNDGCFHQEHLANVAWEGLTDRVKHIFGLTKIETALNEAKVRYDQMLYKIIGAAHYYSGGSDSEYGRLKFEWEEEGRSCIQQLQVQIIQINEEERNALTQAHDTRAQFLAALDQEARRQLLEENDRENEAMDNILVWLGELKKG